MLMLKEGLLSLGFRLWVPGIKEDKVLEMGFKKMSTHSNTKCKSHDAQHHNCKQKKQELVETEWFQTFCHAGKQWSSSAGVTPKACLVEAPPGSNWWNLQSKQPVLTLHSEAKCACTSLVD